MEAEIAVIGGSGFYSLDIIEDPKIVTIDTPFGKSHEATLGRLRNRKVVFLPRHGKEHTIPPHQIDYRTNIWSLHELGVKRIFATAAVGSLKPELGPGSFVLLDQFMDFTKRRPVTFYEGGEKGVVHVDVTEPYCPELRKFLIEAASKQIKLKPTGTYACTEGPRYETSAEVQMLSKMGCDVVGMTNIPECILARELQICYSAVSIVTNFAAGMSDKKLMPEEVSKVMNENIGKVMELISNVIPRIPKKRTCPCKDALKRAKVEF